MKFPARLWLTIALGGCVATRADDSFTYAPGEQEIYRHTFDTTNGWFLDNGLTFVAGGELLGIPNTNWMKANHTFPGGLDLNDGELNFYWSFRTDAAQGEEDAKIYLRLNLTDTPDLIEQFNLTVNLRPGQYGGPPIHAGFYQFYVDEGYDLPHPVESQLIPTVSFTSTNQYENFRLRVRKTGTNTVALEPYWWDRAGTGWQTIQPQPGSTVPLIASITPQMQGYQVVKAVEFQFYRNIPAVDAVAVTRREPTARVTRTTNAPGLFTLDWVGGDAPWLVERSTNLSLPAGGWSLVRTNQTNAASFSIEPGEAKSFYRVRGQ